MTALQAQGIVKFGPLTQHFRNQRDIYCINDFWHCLLEYYGCNNYRTKTAVLHFYLELEQRQKPFSHHIFLKWFIVYCMLGLKIRRNML